MDHLANLSNDNIRTLDYDSSQNAELHTYNSPENRYQTFDVSAASRRPYSRATEEQSRLLNNDQQLLKNNEYLYGQAEQQNKYYSSGYQQQKSPKYTPASYDARDHTDYRSDASHLRKLDNSAYLNDPIPESGLKDSRYSQPNAKGPLTTQDLRSMVYILSDRNELIASRMLETDFKIIENYTSTSAYQNVRLFLQSDLTSLSQD